LPQGKGTILDAGCGAGRSTIAIASTIPSSRIVAFDKFNASYIEGGGVALLKKTLK
jgi:trans-aconitate methyltransferase